MRSLIRYSLVAVGALALMVFTFAMLRPRLEPTAEAQRNGAGGTAVQVAGCNAALAPSTGPSVANPTRTAINPCLVISKFRENGPFGSTDEFVEIFNASTVTATVSTLSNDPETLANGIGVYVSAGQGATPNINAARLACQIKGATRILGRRWFLCAANGVPGANPAVISNALPAGAPAGKYSLGLLGTNSGVAHSTPDATIGGPLLTGGFASVSDIPDDAGIALLDVGTDIVGQCQTSPPGGTGPPGCPSGFNYSSIFGSGQNVVLDKVGFNPYGPGAPANTNAAAYPNNLYPNLAAQYCEGVLTPLNLVGNGSQLVSHNIGCLQPVGDVDVITLPQGAPCPADPSTVNINPLYVTNPVGPNYDMTIKITSGSVINGIAKCYGESGQYAFARRRSGQTFDPVDGEIFKDSWNSMLGNTIGPPAFPGPGGCAQATPPAICGNSDDIMLETPIPASTNVGQNITGIQQTAGVLGVAWPHNCDSVAPNGGLSGVGCTPASPDSPGFPSGAPPIVGNAQFTQDGFDICAGAVIPCATGPLQPRNAERRYAQDPTIWGTANDPFGTFILRFRFTNNFTSGSVATGGQRWRIDDISTNCGGQGPTTFNVIANPPGQGIGTQEARNLRGADASLAAQTPTPTCQGEGSDTGVFTALLKGVNHYGEVVLDSSGTPRVVAGTVLEDLQVCPPFSPPSGGSAAPCLYPVPGGPGSIPGVLQPFGGGSNSTYVINTTAVGNTTLNVAPGSYTTFPPGGVGDGVNGGTGTFAFPLAPGSPFRIAFKFGVVRSGRFKLFLGREVAPVASPGQAVTPTPQP
jgi:hypothetical protein